VRHDDPGTQAILLHPAIRYSYLMGSNARPWPEQESATDMALIGYARVSSEDQATFSQFDDLRAAGCQVVFEEKASGGGPARAGGIG
jgi:hypothetical protein